MDIRVTCPLCKEKSDTTSDDEKVVLTCSCGTDLPVTPTPSMRNDNIVDTCAACSKDLFYLERDINRTLGLWVVGTSFLITCFLMPYLEAWTLLVLIGLAIIDYVFYRMLPIRTVCYRCRAEYRNMTVNSSHRAFDLHVDGVVIRERQKDWIAAEDAAEAEATSEGAYEEVGEPT